MKEPIQINWTNSEARIVSPVHFTIKLAAKEKVHAQHSIPTKQYHSMKMSRMNASCQIQQNLTYTIEIKLTSRCSVMSMKMVRAPAPKNSNRSVMTKKGSMKTGKKTQKLTFKNLIQFQRKAIWTRIN